MWSVIRESSPAIASSLSLCFSTMLQYTCLSKHESSCFSELSWARASASSTSPQSATTRSSSRKRFRTSHSSSTKLALSMSRRASELLHIARSRYSAAAVTSASLLYVFSSVSMSLLQHCWLRMYRHSGEMASAASAWQHAMMHGRSPLLRTPRSRMLTKPVVTKSDALTGASNSSRFAISVRMKASLL